MIKRLYVAVALCAVVVYLGTLWNHFVYDDTVVILPNRLVRDWSGMWKAFTHPYWPVATVARWRGDSAVADSLAARACRRCAVNLSHGGACSALAGRRLFAVAPGPSGTGRVRGGEGPPARGRVSI